MKRTLKFVPPSRLVLAALISVLLVPAARAQAAPPDAGSILRDQQKLPQSLPARPPPVLQEEATPRPSMQAPTNIRFELTSVRITGATVFADTELQALLLDLIGKEISLAELENGAARISRYYRERGYVVARAYVPAQSIRDGLVEIAVLEGRVGRVVLDNHSRVRDSVISARVDGLEGQLVNLEGIERPLRPIYELSGIGPGSHAALREGSGVGETDLVLKMEAEPAANGSLSADNYGSRDSGRNRLSGQVNVVSPTGSGDLLSLTATRGGPDLDLVHLAYQVPLGDSRLLVGADVSHVSYRLGGSFASLQAHGTGDTWESFAALPLVLRQSCSVRARLSYAQGNTQDQTDATATTVDKSSRIGSLAITAEALDDFNGGGSSAASFGYDLGRLDIASPAARAIDDATARTQGQFQKWSLSLTRLQRLADRLAIFVSLSGQQAQKNLDSSEKFTLGGPYGVKAYAQGEAPGDSGFLLDAELRWESKLAPVGHSLQLLALADVGEVQVNHEAYAIGPNRQRLGSIGMGLNWVAPVGLQVRLLGARKVGNASTGADVDKDVQLWVQAGMRF